ncbi:uncharacterized protein TrAtP1_003225 [Trichoderma atroviride]|uniref:uncharacterized protein n=1 Tax=Hypocrea atroviridis TaxID=63577 RepID=UPI00332A8ED9|nr:hypothetical protein TrAtP1_003225 [Trichoderma atroviride]
MSIPSPSDSSNSDIFSEADSEAQEEWERSLEQVQLLLTMILVPWIGKLFGRKFAYWSWGKYMNWVHNVDVKVTGKKSFNAAGAVAATL